MARAKTQITHNKKEKGFRTSRNNDHETEQRKHARETKKKTQTIKICLLYTSDAADE